MSESKEAIKGKITEKFTAISMEEPTDSKRVKFSEDAKEFDAIFTPLRKPHYSAVRKTWIKYSEQGDYENLKKYLLSCQSKGVSTKDFFSHEGKLILSWAIARQSGVKSLQFICENVEKNILKDVFLQDDGHVLKEFLSTESGMDDCHWTNQETLENRIKKIRLLLVVDPESIQKLIENNIYENWVSEGVRRSFKEVLQKYEKSLSVF